MICDPNANALHGYDGIAGPGQPRWFNTSCFAAVPDGVVRPGQRGAAPFVDPGSQISTPSLVKSFLLNESGRWNLLRGEFFNVTNHSNPNGFGKHEQHFDVIRRNHQLSGAADSSDRRQVDLVGRKVGAAAKAWPELSVRVGDR